MNCTNKDTGIIKVNPKEEENTVGYEYCVTGVAAIFTRLNYWDSNKTTNIEISDCTNEADIITTLDIDAADDLNKGEATVAGITSVNNQRSITTIKLNNLINTGNISTNADHVSGVFYGYKSYEGTTLEATNCKNSGNLTTTYVGGEVYGVIGGDITDKTETECENTGTITVPTE